MNKSNNECCEGMFLNGNKNVSSVDHFRNLRYAISQLGYLIYDIAVIYKKDPAINGKLLGFLEVVLYSSVWAMVFYRMSHLLYTMKIPFIPRLLSQVSRFLTGIEIHPGARIGKGFFIDHGNGVVIGETAVIGNNVLLFHQVTLGAKGGDGKGKRHPTLGNNVVIGAGAKIIGNIVVGDNSIVGAGSVVLKEVSPGSIVAGNPARDITKGKNPERYSLPAR